MKPQSVEVCRSEREHHDVIEPVEPVKDRIACGRCFKGYFQDGRAAHLGLARCHGHSDNVGGKRRWSPCRYLVRCLGMSVKEWKEHRVFYS